MRPPIFVRALSDEERRAVTQGLRSADAVVLRRSQIVLASARGERVPQIARTLGCTPSTVRTVIHAFNARGGAALARGSSRPHRTPPVAFTPAQAEALHALARRSPRAFGKPTSLWTLELLAEVCCEQGVTARRVSGEAVRQALLRLGVGWKRAKHWISSPDPAYGPKGVGATA